MLDSSEVRRLHQRDCAGSADVDIRKVEGRESAKVWRTGEGLRPAEPYPLPSWANRSEASRMTRHPSAGAGLDRNRNDPARTGRPCRVG